MTVKFAYCISFVAFLRRNHQSSEIMLYPGSIKMRNKKFTDRLLFSLAFSIILIVILLFMYAQMYIELSNTLKLNPKYDENGRRIQKHEFIKRFGQSISTTEEKSIETAGVISTPTDTFQDIHDELDTLEGSLLLDSSSTGSSEAWPTLGELLNMEITNETTSLERFQMQITANEMYPENSTVVAQLLSDMATMPIQKVDEKDGGTQFKLTITYSNGMNALFKPKRCERDQQNPPNQIYYSEFERHNAEIAAFHVDRLLGFRRALPTTGRTINAIDEIMRIGSAELKKTFFKSAKPDENVCFTGNCRQFCDNHHPICANGEQLEGSFMAYLPDDELTHRRTHQHPYKRTYNPKMEEEWLDDPSFCENVKEQFPMDYGRHMLDFVDTAILDFLIGNRDRHNYQTFEIFQHAFHMHYDHGRSFGRPFFDDLSILAPLSQCCVIRVSTLKKLLNFHHGPMPLSAAMRESLASDPIAPVLWEPHLAALDRRVEKILIELRSCIGKKPIKSVIIFS